MRIKRDAFIKTILKGREAPADLSKLLNEEQCSDLLAEIDCQLIDPDQVPDLISHSYLNDHDRKNPDIMTNVSAINDVFRYITFVVRKGDGEVVGYWHGPEQIPLPDARIVQYDTEGRFNMLPGNTLSEALIGDFVFNDDEFRNICQKFQLCGIEIRVSSINDLDDPDPTTKPNELHDALYNQYRVKAGLEPI